MTNQLERRDFIKLSAGVATTALAANSLWSKATAQTVVSGQGPYGALQSADSLGIMLPAGFQARIVAQAGQTVPGTNHTWHMYPDGGATFAGPDGDYVYVSNSEIPLVGGVGAIRFNANGDIVDAYSICSGTTSNCAGGKTPWGTWLTCEEYFRGSVLECDPFVADSATRRSSLGYFSHEAAAVDPTTGYVYLTEDESDGCFYRFRPDLAGDLSSGTLEVAAVSSAGDVSWHVVPRPTAFVVFSPTRKQVSAATHFDGGEGIVYSQGVLYFTTKGDNKVWEYAPHSEQISVLYDANQDPGRQLTGVDNITASSGGDLIVAEDGGNMELVLISTEGTASPLLRVEGQDSSELTGPAFDPTGTRLYFSSQRGNGSGITYEVTGPFRF